MDELSNIRGKLVQEAESYLLALGLQPEGTITGEDDTARIIARANVLLDKRNLQDYFLHGWDSDRSKILVFSSKPYFNFHEGFWFGRNSPFINDPASRTRISKPSWFMYELSGAAVSLFVESLDTTDSFLFDAS